MGAEIISLMAFLKDAPTLVTSIIAFTVIAITIYLKIKDADISAATSLGKTQNDRLTALMDQNGHLLDSVAKLQLQITGLHDQMSADAEEHRKKMEEMYKVTDEMRKRIIELEELVRKYQYQCNVCPYKKP